MSKSVIFDSYSKIFANKKRIMVVMAHPDDSELYAGGTIARLTSDGKRVRVIKMTNGENGCRQEKISSSELGKIRKSEDRISMKALGIQDEDNIYLEFPDGSVKNNIEVIEPLVKQIRIFKPELIITHNPEDIIIRFAKNINWFNHNDHLNTGLAVINASYPYSRDILFFPEQLKEAGVTSHTCTEFLFVDYYDHPDLVSVDVTEFVKTRIKAHAAHTSQYSLADAQDSADFFTSHPSGLKFERFRYVNAD